MKTVEVKSSIEILAPPRRVWELLCGAKMFLAPPPWFRWGVPTPRECRLPGASGGVGALRECVTDRGTIRQRISRWAVENALEFERVEDTAGLGAVVSEMRDRFTLAPIEGGTRLTRTSTLRPRCRCGINSVLLRCVVRKIHRYVNANFKALAEKNQEASIL